MNISFGICTQYENQNQLQDVVNSIDALLIPNYEIIVVGGTEPFRHVMSMGPLMQIPMDEWITVKKNVIAFQAHYEILVLCHDYYLFDSEWYNEYLKYGTEWDVCSNPQFLIDGTRHATDWITWDDPFYGRYYSLPYYDVTRTRNQYLSGGFLIVKRDFMRDHPFNESMVQGMPEDVEWSLRIRDFADIKCNPNALVRHNKIHRDLGNKSFPLWRTNEQTHNF